MSDPTYTDDGYLVDNCRSCQGLIIWATTVGGRATPIDAVPADGGNIELNRSGPGPMATATIITAPPLFAKPLRKSHFASCPDAVEWRTPK